MISPQTRRNWWGSQSVKAMRQINLCGAYLSQVVRRIAWQISTAAPQRGRQTDKELLMRPVTLPPAQAIYTLPQRMGATRRNSSKLKPGLSTSFVGHLTEEFCACSSG